MASSNHNTETFKTREFSPTQFLNASPSFSGPLASSPVDEGDKIRRSLSFPDRVSEKTGSGQPRFRTVQPVPLPISSSSLLASELRDSPFLLNTSNILPSPTTGAFPFQTSKWSSNSINNTEDKNNCPDHISTQQTWGLQESLKSQDAAKSEYLTSQSISSSGTASVQAGIRGKNVNFQSICGSYQQQTQSDRKDRRSIDGYNWRKYGQKQVKESQNHRSYFKCTYPNCPTTKKVERSFDGQVTQIVYRGKHNHPKAQSTRRSSSSSHSSSSVVTSNASQVSSPLLAKSLNQSFVVRGIQRMDSVATSESSSLSFDNGNFDENSKIQKGRLGGIREFDAEEPDAKRWKENCGDEGTSAAGSRAVTESRVVVRTTSDTDVLDDGYRWRKYGQKVVKGNPNPRSYYKCTSPGCLVRKHIERAADDLRAVITTYEGKHKHAVPLTRRISHSASRPFPRNDNGTKMVPFSESQIPFSLEFVPRNLGFLGSGNSVGSFLTQSDNAKDESKNNNSLLLLESLLE